MTMGAVSYICVLVVVFQVVTGQILAHDLMGRQACSWEGHCAGGLASDVSTLNLVPFSNLFSGANCETENDCDGDLVCRVGRCSSLDVGGGGGRGRTSTWRSERPTPTATTGLGCSWEGHCLGKYYFPDHFVVSVHCSLTYGKPIRVIQKMTVMLTSSAAPVVARDSRPHSRQ